MIPWKWFLILTAWCALGQTVSNLYRQGRYSEAIDLLTAELKQLEAQEDKSRSVASILNNLALTESKIARFASAEAHFLRAIAIWEQDGRAPLELAIGMSNLGGLRARQGRYAESVGLHQRA